MWTCDRLPDMGREGSNLWKLERHLRCLRSKSQRRSDEARECASLYSLRIYSCIYSSIYSEYSSIYSEYILEYILGVYTRSIYSSIYSEYILGVYTGVVYTRVVYTKIVYTGKLYTNLYIRYESSLWKMLSSYRLAHFSHVQNGSKNPVNMITKWIILYL